MKQEIKEALALELTKLIILDSRATHENTKSAELWVSKFNESLKEIEIAITQSKPKQVKNIEIKTSY